MSHSLMGLDTCKSYWFCVYSPSWRYSEAQRPRTPASLITHNPPSYTTPQFMHVPSAGLCGCPYAVCDWTARIGTLLHGTLMVVSLQTLDFDMNLLSTTRECCRSWHPPVNDNKRTTQGYPQLIRSCCLLLIGKVLDSSSRK